MKKVFAVLTLSVALFLNANARSAEVPAIQLSNSEIVQLASVSPLDLIRWKVGDTMSHNVSMASFGQVGNSVKSVTKDEGTALWVNQTVAMMGQNEVIDILISKADGKILKMLRNGQPQQIPDDKIEIISQDYAEITVPAGTFKTLHVVAKSQQISKIEIWANPQATVMDGAVKQVMATQFGDLALELTSFKKGS